MAIHLDLLICLNIVWILLEDDQPLQSVCEREVLICGQLSSVAHTQQHWCRVRLEACDRLRSASLQHEIDDDQLMHGRSSKEGCSATASLYAPQCATPGSQSANRCTNLLLTLS